MKSVSKVSARHKTVALIGNPNTGKSTVFNALTGLNQHIGNYPGVTVEKKTGRFTHQGVRLQLVDLPGTYSLAARSADELVAVDVLLERSDLGQLDAIVVIVDANNLERNLFLFSQVAELQRPVILAVNMIDVAERNGIQLNWVRLRERLGVPVIPIQANKGRGLTELRAAIADIDPESRVDTSGVYPDMIVQAIEQVATTLTGVESAQARFLAQRMLVDSSGSFAEHFAHSSELGTSIRAARQSLSEQGVQISSIESVCRYRWIELLLDGAVTRPAVRLTGLGDRIDAVLTHRVWGTLIFSIVILMVFQAVFSWSQPLIGAIESLFAEIQGWTQAAMAEGALRSLIVDGVLGGIGGVVVFLPQILILFLFIAVMEDCGYLARAAYLMDRLMSRVGLSGKSFIPLLSSFACAIPGVMATRIIENPRDRLVTMLIAPLMSCSARLPVYTLLIAAFIPPKRYLGGLLTLQGLVMFAMYLLGIVTAILVAIVLKRTILKGETPPFVMELPEYKRPAVRQVLRRMAERGGAFLRRAGTLIVAMSILIWAATYYPRSTPPANVEPPAADVVATESPLPAEQLEHAAAAQQMRNSYLGRAARAIEPAVRPLGWDWKIAAGVIASFPAREIVVAAMGVIYSLGDEESETSESLRSRLRTATFDGTDRRVFTIPTALSLLVFFSLCAQCVSTLVVIGRETNSWRWPLFTFAYMTGLAYLAALATYQIGTALAGA